MQRILLIVVALLVVWRVLVTLGKRAASMRHGADSYSRFSPRQRKRRVDDHSLNDQSQPEELLSCFGCGTYVPSGRALTGGDGRFFCSEACRFTVRSGGSDGR